MCYHSTITMSMLFHKKTKKAIKLVWTLIAILIAVSMVFVYSSGY